MVRLEQGPTDPQKWWSLTGQSSSSTSAGQSCPARACRCNCKDTELIFFQHFTASMASFFHHSDSKAGGRCLSTHSGLMQFHQVQGFPTHMCNNTSLPGLSNPGSCVVKLEQGATDSQRRLSWTDLTESGQSSSSTSGRQSCPARGPIKMEGYRVIFFQHFKLSHKPFIHSIHGVLSPS